MLKALGDVIEFQSESEEYPVLEELNRKFLEDQYRKWVDMYITF